MRNVEGCETLYVITERMGNNTKNCTRSTYTKIISRGGHKKEGGNEREEYKNTRSNK